MPIYEYECNCCPSRFELKRSFDDESPVTCPECDGDTRRLFSAVPVIFKGSGFYVTDSRRAGSDSLPEGGDGDAKKDSAKTESTKTDSAKADSDQKVKTGSTEKTT